MYWKAKFDSVYEVRHLMLQSKCYGEISVKSLKSSTINLALFPPSKSYIKQHVAQANYQTRIWKTAKVPTPEVPKPFESHGWLKNGEPLWFDPAMVRQELLVNVPEQEVGGPDNEDEEMKMQL